MPPPPTAAAAPSEETIPLGAASLTILSEPDGSRFVVLDPAAPELVARSDEDLPDGAARATAIDEVSGQRTYRIGTAQLMAEIDTAGWDDETVIDLLLVLGRIVDAAPGHGFLGPWVIALHPHGAVSVLGYGVVPQADPRDDLAAIGELLHERRLGQHPALQALIEQCRAADPSKRPAGGAELVALARQIRATPAPRRGMFRTIGRMIAREWAAPYQRLVVAPRRRREKRQIGGLAAVAAEAAESCRRTFDEGAAQVGALPEGTINPEVQAAWDDAMAELGELGSVADASEAAAAAAARSSDLAEAERHAAEAGTHAQAVEERVPDVVERLARAAIEAGDPSWMVERAVVECAHAAEIVGQLADRAQAAVTEVHDRAAEMEIDELAQEGLEQVEALLEEMGLDRDATTAASDTASELGSVAEAEAAIEAARRTVEQCRVRRDDVAGMVASLTEHLDELESTSQALDDARQTLARAEEVVAGLMSGASAGLAELEAVVAPHEAAGALVDDALAEIRAALDAGRAAQTELTALAAELPEVSEPGEARRVARAVQVHRETVEDAHEGVAAAVATGVSAVERWVADQQERARQALSRARETVERHVDASREVVARVEAAVAEARGEAPALLERTPLPDLEAALEVEGWGSEGSEALQQQLAEVRATDDVPRAEELAGEAEVALESLTARASEVRARIQAALDQARAQADEAEARARARSELDGLPPQVEPALARIQQALGALEAPLRDVPDGIERWAAAQALGTEAHGAAQAVQDRFAQALDEASIEDLQRWVAEARGHTATVVDAADQLERAVSRATVDQARCLADAEARALVAARRAVEDRVAAARAAAEKVAAWRAVGVREVHDAGMAGHPPAGLQSLNEAIDAVDRHAAEVIGLAPEARSTSSAEDAAVVAVRIEEAARLTEEAASAARRALHRLRASLSEHDVIRDAVTQIASEVRGHAVAASQLGERAAGVLSGLEVWTRPVDPGDMDGAVGAAYAACVEVSEAVQRVLVSVTDARGASTVPEARRSADQAGASLQAAMTAAGRMVALEREAHAVLRKVMGRKRPPPTAHLPRNVSRGGLKVGHALRARLQDDPPPE